MRVIEVSKRNVICPGRQKILHKRERTGHSGLLTSILNLFDIPRKGELKFLEIHVSEHGQCVLNRAEIGRVVPRQLSIEPRQVSELKIQRPRIALVSEQDI